MGWADRILEKVRRLADTLNMWCCWSFRGLPPRRDIDFPNTEVRHLENLFLGQAQIELEHERLVRRYRLLPHDLAKLFAASGGFARLRFDAETLIVTMDGVGYGPLHPEAFRYLRVLWQNIPRTMTAAQIARVAGHDMDDSENWSSLVTRAFGTLPEPLAAIHRSARGGGHWIALPPCAQPGRVN
jgi:hypothetical protein